MSDSDSEQAVASEHPLALAVVPATATAAKKGGKKVKEEPQDAKSPCWLCGEEIQGTAVVYKGYVLDSTCKNAIRCHYNLVKGLSADMIEADANMLKEAPEDWKEGVLILATPEGRCRDERERHRAWLNSEAFTEYSYHKKGLLLRKTGFISFMKQ